MSPAPDGRIWDSECAIVSIVGGGTSFHPDPAKVLLVASTFPPVIGGSATVYERLCHESAGAVQVLTASHSYRDGQEIPGWAEFDRRATYPVHRTRLLRPVLSDAPQGLISKVQRYLVGDRRIYAQAFSAFQRILPVVRPGCLCLGELYSLRWLGRQASRGLGLPIVQYVHGEEITMGGGSRHYMWGLNSYLSECAAVVCVSSFTRSLLIERGVDPQRLHLIPNGVDAGRFCPGPRDERLLAKHRLQGRRVLLTVGRLEPKKGQDTLIQALPGILARCPGAALLVVGDGSYGDSLRRLAADLRVEDSVVFAGKVDDGVLPDYYRIADLFAMPNRVAENGDTEGFGLVFLEAGGCGLPVVGGHAGGVVDAVENGVTGLLVDGKSVSAVAEACCRILDNPDLASRMGAAGRQLALGSSWSERASRFRSVCQGVARPAGA